ncbi:MAG: amidohydrolase family protein [Caldilineaceae bacterium]|nr:amidohydrolase family protein [Caldilineaceae bacterium]
MTIIDIHVHHTWADPADPPWALIEETLQLAQDAGISKVGLLGTYSFHGYDPTPEGIRDCNRHAAHIVERYPDLAYSFCYLNPAHDPAFIREELDRCIGDYGMKGIKLWIAVNARDARLAAVMEGARRHQVPVLHHAWYKATGYVYNESTPADLRDLALRFPDVPIIMAHLNGCGVRGILDIQDLPNVAIDTSGSQPDAGFLEFAVAHLGPERILFGSDAPLRDYPAQLAKVTGANIDEAARQQILAGNAARLIQL